LSPVEKFSRRSKTVRYAFAVVLLPQADDLFGMWEIGMAENDGPNDGENICVGSDAQRYRQHDQGGEAGILAQHSPAVAQIL
jgi:hypothetical protein